MYKRQGNTSSENRTGEGHKPLPYPLSAKGNLRLAFALRLIQGFLYGYGAIGGGGQLLTNDIAHQGIVLDHWRYHQIVQGVKHSLAVIGRRHVQIGGQGILVTDGRQIPARLNADLSGGGAGGQPGDPSSRSILVLRCV